MIRLSRRTELIHPVRTMLFYGAQVIVYLAIVMGLGWSWSQLRFSPIQRYYFVAYAEASVGVATGSGSDHVRVDREASAGPRAWQIADPEDLVPASVRRGTLCAVRVSRGRRAGVSSGTTAAAPIRSGKSGTFFKRMSSTATAFRF